MESNGKARLGLTRRGVLVGGAGLAAGWLTGCDLSTDPSSPGGDNSTDKDDNSTGKGKEAPELAKRVEAGDLPPVEERLPETPLVIETTESLGVYGGTWASVINGPADIAWLRNTIGYDGLVRWNPEWNEAIPNVAESFSMDDTGREYTFELRRGMKWSDGEDFTADDIVFAFEDVLTDPEVASKSIGPFLDPSGQPAMLEKIDDYTVRFVFAEPKGLFLTQLADPEGYHIIACPRHYLEQFHQKYNPDVADLVDQEGLSSWIELLERKRNVWDSPELPVVFGWQATTPLADGSRVVAERNPYYWKTDSEGSQLPYINEVVYNVVADPEVMLLQATNGDLGMHARHFNIPSNRPVLANAREKGEYDFFELKTSMMNEMVIMLNLNHKNEVLRNLFQNKDFRIGLSHAINRDEMISAVFQEQGEPWQAAPRSESDYYDEEFATQYLEFDVDQANQHLDDAGLTERDDAGFRLLPNGDGRVSFTVEVALAAPSNTRQEAMELVAGYWKEVGVEIRVNGQDRSIWAALMESNDHDATVWAGAGGLGDELFNGYNYFPFHQLGSRYAMLWAKWYGTRGESGQEPPEHVKQQFDLYDELQSAIDEDERGELFRQILEIAKEQFYVIGTVAPGDSYGIVANNFHNVPESMPVADHYATPGPTRPEQYYIADV